jgi:hypothetical protein
MPEWNVLSYGTHRLTLAGGALVINAGWDSVKGCFRAKAGNRVSGDCETIEEAKKAGIELARAIENDLHTELMMLESGEG